MGVSIRGIGTALPAHGVNQGDAIALARRFSADSRARAALVERIQRRSRVQRRHSVLLESGEPQRPVAARLPFYGERNPSTEERMLRFARHAPALALAASRRALADAGIHPGRITHLVTVSCTGFQAPGFDLELIGQLELDADVERTHVGFMGCHGALNGLRVARAFVEADPQACVLLCSVELCSLHLHYGWDPEKVVANALFADGAAALVLSAGGAEGPRVLASGSTVIPGTAELMSWTIGDHGFAMGLSPRVPAAVAAHLRPWLERWLHGHGLEIGAIGAWALHPGGPRILQASATALDLAPEHIAVSATVLRDHGNMSSATILFILERLRRALAPGPWVALAFGPGLTVEAALLDTPEH
ncbi:type III polyketide synthase [Cyanobium sp. CH-040]|uniref:type III polyketide synthase n=1 Tax=Cyanobium sp. CH-040 TaxID=2823708 RepID=UPI0020CEB9D8|nr:type III polyketide synthase [Cyanobium sp. CH-040]MCP9927500.1 type III polyketide synthase [Cyanobium sp. CH-040]